MRYLFTHWETVAKKLREARHRLLFFDYDGTLAPLAETPGQARMDPAVRRLLAQLARRPASSVGIISGRVLKDVQKRVGLPGLVYVGNHGLELQNGDGPWMHPWAKVNQPTVHALARRLREGLRGIPGLLVEDKGVSVSVHFRRVNPVVRPTVRRNVRSIVNAQASAAEFRIHPGNQVLEVRPRLNWGKGTVVKFFRDHSPAQTLLFYIGDDVADEEAFRVARNRGVAVSIGARHVSKAPYYLRDQSEVPSLLERLVCL